MAWPASRRLTTSRDLTSLARERELRTLRRENEALRQALEARRLVDRAKARIMVQEALSEPEAFGRIQKTSMDTRTPMAEVARRSRSRGGGGRPCERARPERERSPEHEIARPALAVRAPRRPAGSAPGTRDPRSPRPRRPPRPLVLNVRAP
jgi:ANTAR domain